MNLNIIVRDDEIVYYCHERGKVVIPYILAVLRNYNKPQKVKRTMRLLA